MRANNPMQPSQLGNAPRCLAKTRKGTPCQSPAVRGKRRCRMHGGTNPGAPRGNTNAWKHGAYAADTKAIMRQLATT
jgi:glucans biosynthesis protein